MKEFFFLKLIVKVQCMSWFGKACLLIEEGTLKRLVAGPFP